MSHASTIQLIQNPDISFVQFTGSVNGGQSIISALNGRFVSIGLDLGGCDAAYVRSDADLPGTARDLVNGAFFNSGQCCCGIQRIFVQSEVYDVFVDMFVMETLDQFGKIGGPMNPETTLGPLVKTSAADELRALVEQDSKRIVVNWFKLFSLIPTPHLHTHIYIYLFFVWLLLCSSMRCQKPASLPRIVCTV